MDAIRILVARLSQRYDIRGATLYDGFENGGIRRSGSLKVVVLLGQDLADPEMAAVDMGWDALALHLESGFRIEPVPVFYGHWQEPASAPDPGYINDLKMKSLWLWL